jgi:hypothetical protein
MNGVPERAIQKLSGRCLDLLSCLVIVVFAATLALGALVPLYVDEMATKLIQARLFADGTTMASLFPQCASGFALDLPLAWYPAALVHAVVYSGSTPLGFRLTGVTLALAWLALFASCAMPAIAGPQGRLRCVAGLVAVLSLGVLPLTLVISRPEQWLMLLITAYLALPLLAQWPPFRRRAWAPVIALAAFLLLTSLLTYSHPKAVLLLPLALVSASYLFGRRHRWLLAVAVASTMLCAWQSYQFAKEVTRCEDAPRLAGILRKQTLDPSALAASPGGVLREAAGNIVSAPDKIIARVRFQSSYQSGWLPPIPAVTGLDVVRQTNASVTAALYVVFGLGAVLSPVVILLTRRREADGPRGLLFAALWAGLVANVALYREWHFYGGALVVTMAAILTIHCAMRLCDRPVVARIAGVGLAVVLALSLLSTAVLAYQVAPRLLELTKSRGEALVGQPYSVNVFAFDGVRGRIRNLADACGVRGDGARRLVIDELSYFAFERLRQPLHAAFIWPGGWGADLAGRIGRFLVDMESEGFVAQCTFLPAEFRYQALRDGNICCVNLRAVYLR